MVNYFKKHKLKMNSSHSNLTRTALTVCGWILNIIIMTSFFDPRGDIVAWTAVIDETPNTAVSDVISLCHCPIWSLCTLGRLTSKRVSLRDACSAALHWQQSPWIRRLTTLPQKEGSCQWALNDKIKTPCKVCLTWGRISASFLLMGRGIR